MFTPRCWKEIYYLITAHNPWDIPQRKNPEFLPLTGKPGPELMELISLDGFSNSLKKLQIVVRVMYLQ